MTAINSNRAIRGPVTAVPVVAGKGVRLTADTVNNRWVVEADETVLWEGSVECQDNATLTLSESVLNFKCVDFYMIGYNDGNRATEVFRFVASNKEYCLAPQAFAGTSQRINHVRLSFNNLVGTFTGTVQYIIAAGSVTTANDRPYMVKVVGVNRVASA